MGTSLANREVRAAIWAEHGAIAEGILCGAARAAGGAATHHAEKAGAGAPPTLERGGAAPFFTPGLNHALEVNMLLSDDQLATFSTGGISVPARVFQRG